MARKPVIIKKYENRRLYDSTNSRYINQDEVAEMIRDGREVQVVDAATGEDLTRLVMTQIIVEDAKEQESAFPLDILRQMVVASGKATKENTLKYVKAVLDVYQNAYRVLAPPLNPLEYLRPHRAPQEPTDPRSPWTPDAPRADADHVQELQRRVEELEGLIGKMRPRNVTTKRKRAKPKSKPPRKP